MEAALIPTPTIHMWFTFAMIVGGLLLYASEKLLVEVASLILLSSLLLFFHFYPLADVHGKTLVSAADILQGFSNPALLAVMSLLVLGQAVIRTGALIGITNIILKISRSSRFFSIGLTQILTACISTFINDTPTCVMFMPVMSTLARKLKISASKVMIPLSYAAILGGTVTLIGSSTNLLVSGAVEKAGLPPLGLFDFTLPGLIIAGVGLLYVLLILPFLLPNHAPLANEFMHDPSRQFFGQLDIDVSSPLAGKPANSSDLFGELDIAPKMLQRGEHAFLPPFEPDMVIKPGDVLIFTATRAALTELFSEKNRALFGAALQTSMEMEGGADKMHADLSLAEILIPPNSRMIGRNISQIGLHQNHNCIVLGIQRRARTITSRMTEQRLAPGDVLLIMGKERNVHMLRKNKDMMLMEWATEELPSQVFARKSLAIFAATVAVAAFDIVPIHISALVGATLLIVTRCLNWQQARRAIGTQIIMLVAAGLALSTALEATGGATYLAYQIVHAMEGLSPVYVMAAMFLFMGMVTNVLSNNATALIFTPIAINTAHLLKADPYMFIFAVIFASNCCSFATPIGYQTNLLVMGPGHYRFMDYVKAGTPLLLLVWGTYTIFCYFHFGYAPKIH